MRLFELRRYVDETDASSDYLVAQGVEFDDGTCAIRWLTAHRSTAVYGSLVDVVAIHGHAESAQVVFPYEDDGR